MKNMNYDVDFKKLSIQANSQVLGTVHNFCHTFYVAIYHRLEDMGISRQRSKIFHKTETSRKLLFHYLRFSVFFFWHFHMIVVVVCYHRKQNISAK